MAAIRKRCQRARIIIRGDSGFGREAIMAWCERQAPRVYYYLGLARNRRLEELLAPTLALARERHCLSGAAHRRTWANRRLAGEGYLQKEGAHDRERRGRAGLGPAATSSIKVSSLS